RGGSRVTAHVQNSKFKIQNFFCRRGMFFARFYDLPVLETPRLTLRALTLQDAPRLFAYGRRPETTTFTLWDPHRSLADAQAFVADAMRAREEGLPHPWGVVERASGLLVGTAGFASLQLAHASGEVGYALDPDYWGRGYATEALHAVLQSGFQDFSCNR